MLLLRIYALCWGLLGALSCYAQPQLYPIKKDGLWGFINNSGKLVIANEYEQVAPFLPNGLAIVRKNKLLGAIDSAGKVQIPCAYQLLDTVGIFANYFIAEQNDVWKLISNRNELILDSISGKVSSLADAELYFTVENEQGLALMHLKRGLIVPYRYQSYQWAQNHHFYVQNEDKLFGLIDAQGQNREVLAPQYDDLRYKDGHIFAKKDYRWAVLDTTGKIIYDFIHDYGFLLSNKLFALQPHTAGQLNLYHKDSSELIIAGIDSAEVRQERAVFAYKWGLFGILNMDGQQQLPIKYKRLSRLPQDSLFWIAHHSNGNLALLDNDYNLLIDADYTQILPYSSDGQLWRVQQNGRWGVYDCKANFLSSKPQFTALSALDYSVALGQSNDTFWVFNRNMDIVWENAGLLKDLALNSNSLTYQNQKNTKQVIQFDAEGKLVDNSNYSNYNRLRVSKKNDLDIVSPRRITPVISPRNPIALGDSTFWVYDNRKKIHKWGIRDSANKRWRLPPTYNEVKVFEELGFSLGFIAAAGETNLKYDRAEFTFMGTNTLISNKKALPISQPEFISIKMDDFKGDNPVARCVFVGGEHGLISKTGRIITRGYVYIGEFHEGKARATKRGVLKANLELGINQLPPLEAIRSYLQGMGINFSVSCFGSNAYLEELYKNGLVCENAKWGFINEEAKEIVPFQYDYVSDFHQNSATILQKGRWGLINANNQLLLTPEFETMQFLPNSNRNLYQITAYESKSGAVDTLGNLIAPIEYDRLRLAEGFIAVQKQNLWGFINAKGEIISECQYNNARPFSEGRAAVFARSRWGFINEQGQQIIKPNYASVGDFHQNMAWVRIKNGQMGYINPQGEIIFQDKFTTLTDFVDTVACARDKNLYWGIINQRGEWICPPNKKFEKIILQKGSNRARAQIGDKFVIINLQGKILSKPYAVIRDFHEGKAVVRKNFANDGLIPIDDDWGFVDTNGRLIGKLQYQKLGDFSHNRALFYEAGKGWGYINPAGQTIIPAQFFEARPFEGERAIVFIKHNQSGLIDTNGTVIMQPKHNKILAREENICLVRGGAEHYYYLTEDLKRVFPLVFQDAKTFRHNVAAVKRNNFWGLVNSQGFWLISPKYQTMQEFNVGFAQVGIHTRYGVATTEGKVIIPPKYEFVEFVGNDIFRVENGNKVGYINIKGDWLWQMSD